MSKVDYPNLFTPITLRGTLFKNRIFASPTGYQDMDKDGILPPEAAFYYERKAIGGAACVAVGECNVDGEFGTGARYAIRLDNPYARFPLFRITDAVRRQGAVCTAELQHAGNCANRFDGGSGIAFGPVAGETNGRPFAEMSEDMIWRIVEKFARGAAFAKSCGFGMVTLHGGHGWLISQFLSPALNTRKDKWGGADIENRSRLAVEILKAIRKTVGPGFPIELRISGSECYAGGYDIEEGIKFAGQVEKHIDLLHVSAGSHEVEEVFTVTHPSMFLPDGCNVKFAAEIKKHVNCAVATVGALSEPDMMEEIIASGQADVIEIARGLIADPDIPRKIRTGKSDEINKCLKCLNCFSNLVANGQFHCAINPETGREAEIAFAKPPSVKKRVLIAGGGVAGLQAALTCAGQGHEVILCEKSATLGGTLRCEKDVPFKSRLDRYLTRQAEKVLSAGVEIRLNTEVTPDYAESQGTDVIIAALGARPFKPTIQGIDGSNVLCAETAYVEPDKVGKSTVILGAGLVGVELGIYLAMLGRKVTIVEMANEINHGGNDLHVKALKVEIRKYSIDMNFSTKALAVTEQGVVCQTDAGERFFAADTVIYAVGQTPLQAEAAALSLAAPDFYPIGDCVAPRNIMNATSMAYFVAQSIGR
jgi:2,4-dienoyl-CoA reductase-like NADH-dependent reductase (Old Yellow Enzyme family)/thioredoxin reductase